MVSGLGTADRAVISQHFLATNHPLRITMKILAVHPSPLMYTKIFLRLEPLGIELIAASARRAGHDGAIDRPPGRDSRSLSRMVREWRPDAIAISNNYLANVPEVIDLAKMAKAIRARGIRIRRWS